MTRSEEYPRRPDDFSRAAYWPAAGLHESDEMCNGAAPFGIRVRRQDAIAGKVEAVLTKISYGAAAILAGTVGEVSSGGDHAS